MESFVTDCRAAIGCAGPRRRRVRPAAGSLALSLAVVTALALAACGGGGSPSPIGFAGATTHLNQDGTVDNWLVAVFTVSGEAVASPAVEWPSWVPREIPPFPAGQVGTSAPRAYWVGSEPRPDAELTLTGVTRDGFDAYLVSLGEAGYQLKGIVGYKSDKSKAESRLNAGQYDKIEAIKPPLRLQFDAWPYQYPSDVVANGVPIGLAIWGLTAEQKAAIPGFMDLPSGSLKVFTPPPQPAASWPADWADKLPPPEGCTFSATDIVSMGGILSVNCRYPDADPEHHKSVVAAYRARLLAAGFAVQSETPGSGTLIMRKGTLQVMITSSPTAMNIAAMERP